MTRIRYSTAFCLLLAAAMIHSVCDAASPETGPCDKQTASTPTQPSGQASNLPSGTPAVTGAARVTSPTANSQPPGPGPSATAVFAWESVIVLLLIALTAAVVLSACLEKTPWIPHLKPSFFFWLDILYFALLLLAPIAYVNNMFAIRTLRYPFAGILPIAVPWFGALGAVTISMQGVFLWNKGNEWKSEYNYWHIARPLLGAVIGVVAFFMLIVVNTTSGSPPKFSANPPPGPCANLVYYVLAFVAGYREETFRELIKRVTDLIVGPSQTSTAGKSGKT